MGEKFWLWLAAAAFAGVILVAFLYAVRTVRECERQGGVMVRSFSPSGWSCVTGAQTVAASS